MPYLIKDQINVFGKTYGKSGEEVCIKSTAHHPQICVIGSTGTFFTHIDNLTEKPFEVVAIAEPVEDMVLVTPVKLKKATKNQIKEQIQMF